MTKELTPAARNLALRILSEHRLMSLATNRSDGWPQATTVSYVNEALVLYGFISRMSQKYMNIVKDPRVSVCMAGEFSNPREIRGVSLAGRAEQVLEKDEYSRIWQLFRNRFPEYDSWPQPNPALAPLVRIVPTVISVVDYAQEFGHSESFRVSAHDLHRAPA